MNLEKAPVACFDKRLDSEKATDPACFRTIISKVLECLYSQDLNMNSTVQSCSEGYRCSFSPL